MNFTWSLRSWFSSINFPAAVVVGLYSNFSLNCRIEFFENEFNEIQRWVYFIAPQLYLLPAVLYRSNAIMYTLPPPLDPTNAIWCFEPLYPSQTCARLEMAYNGHVYVLFPCHPYVAFISALVTVTPVKGFKTGSFNCCRNCEQYN